MQSELGSWELFVAPERNKQRLVDRKGMAVVKQCINRGVTKFAPALRPSGISDRLQLPLRSPLVKLIVHIRLLDTELSAALQPPLPVPLSPAPGDHFAVFGDIGAGERACS
jgi:hypothetical protein